MGQELKASVAQEQEIRFHGVLIVQVKDEANVGERWEQKLHSLAPSHPPHREMVG